MLFPTTLCDIQGHAYIASFFKRDFWRHLGTEQDFNWQWRDCEDFKRMTSGIYQTTPRRKKIVHVNINKSEVYLITLDKITWHWTGLSGAISSATAEGPRDALCQSKCRQLLHNCGAVLYNKFTINGVRASWECLARRRRCRSISPDSRRN